MFLCTVAFIALSMWAVSKMSRRWQNVMFVLCAFAVSAAIFYRFAMGLTWEGGITLKPLLYELLQVCNFNFILVWLMLIPRFELARQYSVYFSMFAASTTLFALHSNWATLPWHATTVFNSWFYHAGVVILTLWMVAARRLKPRRDYIWKVTLCVIGYFTLVAIITPVLWKYGIIPETESFSYIFDTDGIGAFEFFYNILPKPYFYLYLIVPLMVAFFYGLAWLFGKYRVERYGKPNDERPLGVTIHGIEAQPKIKQKQQVNFRIKK